MEPSAFEWLVVRTPYLGDWLKYLIQLVFVWVAAWAFERFWVRPAGHRELPEGEVVALVRLWKNTLGVYLLANAVAVISGGMGNIALSYVGYFAVVFGTFRTIDRLSVFGALPELFWKSCESLLYLIGILALARELLYPSL